MTDRSCSFSGLRLTESALVWGNIMLGREKESAGDERDILRNFIRSIGDVNPTSGLDRPDDWIMGKAAFAESICCTIIERFGELDGEPKGGNSPSDESSSKSVLEPASAILDRTQRVTFLDCASENAESLSKESSVPLVIASFVRSLHKSWSSSDKQGLTVTPHVGQKASVLEKYRSAQTS